MASSSRIDDILAGLSSHKVLSQRVARLEGRWRSTPAAWPLLEKARTLNYRRVLGVGRFWPDPPDPTGLELVARRAQAVLAGMAAAQSPLGFVVRGRDRQLSIYWGAAPDDLVDSLLHAQFPGIRLAEAAAAMDLQEDPSLPNCFLVTGVPSRPGQPEKLSLPSEGLDRLVRGLLYSGNWALTVVAWPLAPAEDDAMVDGWSAQVEAARQEFKPGDTVLAASDRLAELYLELLELQLQRALVGRTQGNWLTYTYLLADAANAGALAVAALGEAQSRPEPLRVLPCDEREAFSSRDNTPTWLNSADLANLVQFPLQEYPGFGVEAIGRFDVNVPPRDEDRPGISLGWVQDLGTPTGHEFRLEPDRLTGHALIAGTTDSGKTNTSFYLLKQLHGCQVPFLVIEPTKGEYRYLRASFPEMQLFTLGSSEAPLKANPFYVPPGVSVQSHIDFLLSLFAASFVLYAPMPYVLEAALYEVYQDKGWDLALNLCRRGRADSERAFPTLTDLYLKVNDVVDRLGYDTRINADVKAALHARLNSLRIGAKGAMLDTHTHLNVAELLKQPAVVEMGAVGDDEQKAFLIGLLLMMVYEHYRARGIYVADVPLQHVTIIEEAHRLLQSVSQTQGGDFANPRGKAVDTFANIIAEIRAYGEGFIVVEQSPTKLAPDVLKNTNLKIIHRLVSGDDREAMVRSANLDERQALALASLPRGQAALFTTGMDHPMLVSFPGIKGELAPQTPAGDSALPAQPRTLAAFPLAQTVPEEPGLLLEFVHWLLSTVFGSSDGRSKHAARLRTTVHASLPFALRSDAMEAQVFQAVLPRLADQVAARLGAFYDWSFADEELALAEIVRLWPGGKPSARLSNLLTEGTRVNARPYGGCEPCPAPCRYRYFATLAAGGSSQQAETARMMQQSAARGPAGLRHLTTHARYLAARVIDPSAADMASGIGLCVLVAAAHQAGWPGWAVVETAERAWRELAPRDTEA